MKTTGESPSPPETRNGRAAEGNCVAARRGGEQPEAEPWSQTRVNPIRPSTVASPLAGGEACRKSSDCSDPHPSSKGMEQTVEGGWGENVVKLSCTSMDSSLDRTLGEQGQGAVRAAEVVQASHGKSYAGEKSRDRGTKPSNDRWSERRQGGGLAEDRQREATSAQVPAGDKQAEEDLWQRYRAEYGVWTKPMLMALERGVKGNKWFSLIDKIRSEKTLELAWEKVKSNAGACGVDGITVERYSKDSQTRLLAVKEQLKAGTYQPKPVKRVWIPKPGSAEKRPLGIPTVQDRVVQAAVRMVIEPIFESQFAEQSYGFRPGRGCKEALRRVEKLLKAGHTHVVDVDIKGYFDAIPHDKLMEKVRERIADGRVQELLEGFLKQGVIEGTEWKEAKEEGTPQGGVISPLLANVYLDPLDWLMAGMGFEMVRYADDMVVLCRSREEAETALEKLREWTAEAGLTLHPEKTRLVDMNGEGSHFDFLGYRFKRSRRGEIMRLVRPKSLRKLRESIKPITRRTAGRSMEVIIREVNQRLKGWYGYFKQAKATALETVDKWVRGRLRSILRKRRKRRGRARGRDHQRWPNHYFTELGLYSLIAARNAEIISLKQ